MIQFFFHEIVKSGQLSPLCLSACTTLSPRKEQLRIDASLVAVITGILDIKSENRLYHRGCKR